MNVFSQVRSSIEASNIVSLLYMQRLCTSVVQQAAAIRVGCLAVTWFLDVMPRIKHWHTSCITY